MNAQHRQSVTPHPLRVLVVEDRDNDELLLLEELARGGYTVTHTRVETEAALRAALAGGWEIVLSDFQLPTMTAHDVLRVVKAERPDLPCIVISGTITEDLAVDILRAGARDFIVKERLARLIPAIDRELHESAERRRLTATAANLQTMRERMQFALEASRVGTWEVDVKADVAHWSDVCEAIHGLAPGTFAGNLNAFVELVHPDDRDRLLKAVDAAMRERRELELEYRILRPDGTERRIRSMARFFYDEEGLPTRGAGIAVDITERWALEEQLRQAQKMESIGNLAGGIAHDFNNLLTVIGAECELTASIVSDPEVTTSLEAIRIAAQSAAVLTRRLLTFSRRQMVVPRVIDLNDTIRGFEKVLRRLVEENVRIEYRFAPTLGLVRIDPGQVEQVVLNLVANARDAMPTGGTIIIETSQTTVDDRDPLRYSQLPPGTYATLSVIDTGCGMSADVRAHLFEPFFTTKPEGRGTGLGLATVHGIVTQSAGDICVHSQEGEGARFDIRLPVVSASAGITTDKQAAQPGTLRGTETILIVEDNAQLRGLAERVLRQYGYRVLTAANGAQARQVCLEHAGTIALLLTDVVMPDESGPSIAEWIAQRHPGIKTLYMSGYAAEHPGLAGSKAFLPKPFTGVQLVSAVRDALSSRGRATAC